jgi:hypothetical protein
MARKSYDELVREIAELKARIGEYERAGKKQVVIMYERYVSVPLHRKQIEAGKEHYENLMFTQDYIATLSDGTRQYQDIHESIFLEYKYVSLIYEADEYGNLASGLEMYGLIPV